MTGTESEEWRSVCEARHWLRQGYITSDRVGALITRITAERGEDAAKRLRNEMRRQWSRRREWMRDVIG
jgi:hypothetical protein